MSKYGRGTSPAYPTIFGAINFAVTWINMLCPEPSTQMSFVFITQNLIKGRLDGFRNFQTIQKLAVMVWEENHFW